MKGKVAKIYAVFDGFKLKECAEIDDKSDCVFWIKVIQTGQTHTTRFNNTWPVCEYLFYNKKDEAFYYMKNGWWINWLRDPSKIHMYSPVEMLIHDPKKKFRFLESRSGDLTGVMEAIRFLEKLGDYQDWAHFDLKVERDELIKKVESFRNTGIYKRIKMKFNNLQKSGEWDKVWELRDKPAFSKDFYQLWISEPKKPEINSRKYQDYYNS